MKFLQACKDTIKYSIPMISSRLIGTAMGFVGMLMIAHLGHQQLAAGALVSSLSITLNVIFWSPLFSISVLVARCYSEKKYHDVGCILQYGLILGSLMGLLLMLIYWIVGPLLLYLYQEKVLVVLVIQWLLAIIAFSQIFDTVRNIVTGSLRAFHDTKFPMINGFIVSWGISIPIGYVLAFCFHLGPPGIAAGYIFGFFIGAVVLLRRFYNKIQ